MTKYIVKAPTRTKELFLPQRITHYQEIDGVIDSWQHDLSMMWHKNMIIRIIRNTTRIANAIMCDSLDALC